VLQCVAMCCNALQCVLQCVVVCVAVCVAVCQQDQACLTVTFTPAYVAVCVASVLQRTAVFAAVCCSVLAGSGFFDHHISSRLRCSLCYSVHLTEFGDVTQY